jgi:hypothetical protein
MWVKSIGVSIVTLTAFCLLTTNVSAQYSNKPEKPFKDTLDNAFDISYYLYNLHGFLPIVSPITEPAVGYGAAGSGLFFIPKKNKPGGKYLPPDIVGFAGGYTQNKTWFVGAGYFGFWKDDHIRYRGAGGYGDIHLKYYGKGDGFLNDNPAKFTINVYGFIQQAIFRLKNSNFLLGGKYVFAKTRVTAFEDSKLPWIDPKEFDFTNSGIGAIGEFENFDNIFSPNKGFRINLTYNQFLEGLGSDRNYGTLSSFVLNFYPVIPNRWISGLRTEYQMATGDPPFFSYPFLILRGVPAMRYQGKYTILGETEQLVMLTNRWGVVGFGGYGKTFSENNEKHSAWNAGGGFRYLLARVFGLRMGIDVARGPEEWAVYIVFGNSWLR